MNQDTLSYAGAPAQKMRLSIFDEASGQGVAIAVEPYWDVTEILEVALHRMFGLSDVAIDKGGVFHLALKNRAKIFSLGELRDEDELLLVREDAPTSPKKHKKSKSKTTKSPKTKNDSADDASADDSADDDSADDSADEGGAEGDGADDSASDESVLMEPDSVSESGASKGKKNSSKRGRDEAVEEDKPAKKAKTGRNGSASPVSSPGGKNPTPKQIEDAILAFAKVIVHYHGPKAQSRWAPARVAAFVCLLESNKHVEAVEVKQKGMELGLLHAKIIPSNIKQSILLLDKEFLMDIDDQYRICLTPVGEDIRRKLRKGDKAHSPAALIKALVEKDEKFNDKYRKILRDKGIDLSEVRRK